MKKLIVVAMFIVMTSSGAFAAGKLKNNVGCGIGTLLFEEVGRADGGWLLQCTAQYTNAFFSASFTMTTGTINCQGKPDQVVSAEVYDFVAANLDDLAKDAAMGGGATVDSLAAMLNVQDKDGFASSLQSNFTSIFPNSEVEFIHVANTIVSLV